jgi:hypothetical protein
VPAFLGPLSSLLHASRSSTTNATKPARSKALLEAIDEPFNGKNLKNSSTGRAGAQET